jgi:hypothetical protein
LDRSGLGAAGAPSRKDFVGWTGIGPIAFFIEYAIGIKADAPANKPVEIKI